MGIPVTPYLSIVLSALPISAILLTVQKYLIVFLICVSLMTGDIELSIHTLTCHLHIFFGRVSVEIFCPVFNGDVCFLIVEF